MGASTESRDAAEDLFAALTPPLRPRSSPLLPCRAVGTTLSHEVTKRFGGEGLPPDTIHLKVGLPGQGL